MTTTITCSDCAQAKGRAEFAIFGKRNFTRLATRCLACRQRCTYNAAKNRARSGSYYQANREEVLAGYRARRAVNIAYEIVKQAKGRAKKYGLAFDLTPDDLTIPVVCPVLGIPIRVNKGVCGPNSPSLDRIDPAGGYVRGNVVVVSHRANTIKSDATIQELESVLAYYRGAVTAAET